MISQSAFGKKTKKKNLNPTNVVKCNAHEQTSEPFDNIRVNDGHVVCQRHARGRQKHARLRTKQTICVLTRHWRLISCPVIDEYNIQHTIDSVQQVELRRGDPYSGESTAISMQTAELGTPMITGPLRLIRTLTNMPK